MIAQDEATPQVFGMPRSAMASDFIDWILADQRAVGPVLLRLVKTGSF